MKSIALLLLLLAVVGAAGCPGTDGPDGDPGIFDPFGNRGDMGLPGDTGEPEKTASTELEDKILREHTVEFESAVEQFESTVERIRVLNEKHDRIVHEINESIKKQEHEIRYLKGSMNAFLLVSYVMKRLFGLDTSDTLFCLVVLNVELF